MELILRIMSYKLQTFCAIFCCLLISFCNADSVDSEKESSWAPFCNQEIFYKPYVRIKEGRKGHIIKDLGPGLHEVKDLENIYVCCNGLVFLYFKIQEKNEGQVYDDAVMQYASHYCGFYNGKPGPGMVQRENTLVAILLLGHADDYRQVAMQMFTAPIFNPATNTTTNFTSLAIINTDGECILERGKEKARIRVKGNPSEEIQKKTYEATEEHHTTLCRLDGHLLMQDDESKIPLDKEWATKEEAMNILSLSQEANSAEIKLVGCYKYPLLDQEQVNIIEKRKNDTLAKDYNIKNAKSEFNPQDGQGLKFWTKERIAKYGNPTESSGGEEEALKNEVNQKNETLLKEKAKDRDSRNAELMKTTEEELKMAVLKLKLAPLLKRYNQMFQNATKYADEAKAAWEQVAKFVEDGTLKTIMKNYSEVQEEIARLQHHKSKSPYDPKMQIRITEAYQNKEEYKEKLWEKTLELGPLITKAEVASSRRRSYGSGVNDTMGKIQRMIVAYERSHKPLDNKWDFKEKPDSFKDVVVSVKNAQSGDMPACLTFERKEDQCKKMKPSAKRACQLAKVKIGGAKDWGGGDNDKWRDEVLELMDEIFTKACSRLQGDLAKGVNTIIKAYLTKQIEPEKEKETVSGAPNVERSKQNFASNYKITKEEDLYPPVPEKNNEHNWDQIIEQLKKCANDTNPLEFTVESSSNSPLRITHNGKQLPKIVEQADMEFSFNWVIDTNFRIFATVLGLCSKELEEDGLAKKFYDGYTQGFLDPIRTIWLDIHDNPTFSMIFGQYYITGKGDLWTRHCMEASYHQMGKLEMLPLRPILVNSYTEPNYFAKGPNQGTRGPYYGTPN